MHPRLIQLEVSESFTQFHQILLSQPCRNYLCPPVLDADAVTKFLRTFPAETASGPIGPHIQHVRDTLEYGGTIGVLEHFFAVVNLLAQGRASALYLQALCWWPCRPIAVGELFRHLTDKSDA